MEVVLVDTIAKANDAIIVVADAGNDIQKTVGIAVMIFLIILCSFAKIAIIKPGSHICGNNSVHTKGRIQ